MIGRKLTLVQRGIQTGLKHLKPIIEDRKTKIENSGPDYPGKPVTSISFFSKNTNLIDKRKNDALSWLMDEAKDEERSTYNLALRVLTLNFAAIHTTSMVCICKLFYFF